MSTTTTVDVVGTARDRVDGRLKVTGAATYPIDVALPGIAHAVLVQSTVTSGRIRRIAVDAAERAPGVLAVITHVNAPALAQGPITQFGPSPLPPLQSDVVLHYGQHVAMVVAETREQAEAAATLIEVTYERDAPVSRSTIREPLPCSIHGRQITIEATYGAHSRRPMCR